MTELVIGAGLGALLVVAVFIIFAQFAVQRAQKQSLKVLTDKLSETTERCVRFEDIATKAIMREREQAQRPLLTDDNAKLIARIVYDYIKPYLELHVPGKGLVN